MTKRRTLTEVLDGRTQFGDYEVLGEGAYHPKMRMVTCRCKCGTIRDVESSKLRSGRSTCCKGCAATSPKRLSNLKHGMTGTPEHAIWTKIVFRCTSPKDPHYPDYGGRGITVCDRWKEDFRNFYSDMGPRPSRIHSIDRMDNDGHYAPGNCRWALPKEQSANRRRTLKTDIGGVEKPTSWLAHEAGIGPATLASRLQRGWTVEEAMSKPVENRRPKHRVGDELLTASEIERRFGVSRQRLNYRLRHGLSVTEAISLG